MIRTSRTALAALALLALAARPAAAQTIPSSIRYVEESQGIEPFAGYVFTDPNLALTDSTSVDIGPRSAPIFGLRYTIRVSGPLSLRASAGYIPSTREVFFAELAAADSSQIRPVDTGRRVDAGILLLEAGILFHLTGPRAVHNLAPYIGVNGGYARTVTGSDPLESDIPAAERYDFGPSFAVGVSGGTDLFLTRRVALRLELNGRLWRETAPAGFRSSTQSKISEWNNASSAQIGAVLHF
ncbi:MAG TPA: hypothetical protein VF541_20720 [Longimicrobium sp.]